MGQPLYYPGAAGRGPRGQQSQQLPRVKPRICFAQQALNRLAVPRTDRHTEAEGKLWTLAVVCKAFTDASPHAVGRLHIGFRQDKCKLIAAETGRSINVSATRGQNISEPAKRLASHHMSVAVVGLFQSVDVKKQQSKLSVGALLRLISESITSIRWR